MDVRFDRKALKDLRAVPGKDRVAIVDKLTVFARTGAGDVKKLTDRTGFRLRHGDWRALFTMDDGVLVVRVLHRREAYE